jgi:hypothetical protein
MLGDEAGTLLQETMFHVTGQVYSRSVVPHVDRRYAQGDGSIIANGVTGGAGIVVFTSILDNTAPPRIVVIHPGDVYVFSGAYRELYTHAVYRWWEGVDPKSWGRSILDKDTLKISRSVLCVRVGRDTEQALKVHYDAMQNMDDNDIELVPKRFLHLAARRPRATTPAAASTAPPHAPPAALSAAVKRSDHSSVAEDVLVSKKWTPEKVLRVQGPYAVLAGTTWRDNSKPPVVPGRRFVLSLPNVPSRTDRHGGKHPRGYTQTDVRIVAVVELTSVSAAFRCAVIEMRPYVQQGNTGQTWSDMQTVLVSKMPLPLFAKELARSKPNQKNVESFLRQVPAIAPNKALGRRFDGVQSLLDAAATVVGEDESDEGEDEEEEEGDASDGSAGEDVPVKRPHRGKTALPAPGNKTRAAAARAVGKKASTGADGGIGSRPTKRQRLHSPPAPHEKPARMHMDVGDDSPESDGPMNATASRPSSSTPMGTGSSSSSSSHLQPSGRAAEVIDLRNQLKAMTQMYATAVGEAQARDAELQKAATLSMQQQLERLAAREKASNDAATSREEAARAAAASREEATRVSMERTEQRWFASNSERQGNTHTPVHQEPQQQQLPEQHLHPVPQQRLSPYYPEAQPVMQFQHPVPSGLYDEGRQQQQYQQYPYYQPAAQPRYDHRRQYMAMGQENAHTHYGRRRMPREGHDYYDHEQQAYDPRGEDRGGGYPPHAEVLPAPAPARRLPAPAAPAPARRLPAPARGPGYADQPRAQYRAEHRGHPLKEERGQEDHYQPGPREAPAHHVDQPEGQRAPGQVAGPPDGEQGWPLTDFAAHN